ncbi:MAG: cell division protein ZapE [Betaproteobacteria bacterium]|nr:cell division protein ZapE [Betaproteobacteria bacterium]
MPHIILKVPPNGVIDAYTAALAGRGFEADAAQWAAVQRLQRLYSELLAFKVARRGALRKMLSRAKPPRGLYFWGGVGRGKSFLMDAFYGALPYRRKRRVHFHAFMQEVHVSLDAFKRDANGGDAMERLAGRIATELRLLCFDEFHVSDIADAMILGRLLEMLLARGVVLVMTSNYPPKGLYPGGLQRERFLPAIALIERMLDVIEIDAGVDYRLRALSEVEHFLVPANGENDARMESVFLALSGAVRENADGPVEVLGRPIPVRRRARGVIWFDFAALCEGPRSQNDYLELAREYHTLLLSGIPRLSPAQANAARRFTWLIDILYDHKVQLIASADCAPEEIYVEGVQSQEFFRTVSRLAEMRSHGYLAQTHLPGNLPPEIPLP